MYAPLKVTLPYTVRMGDGWSVACSAKDDLTLYCAERVRDG